MEKRKEFTRVQPFVMDVSLAADFFSISELIQYVDISKLEKTGTFDLWKTMEYLIKNKEDVILKSENKKLIQDYQFFKELYKHKGVVYLKDFENYLDKTGKLLRECGIFQIHDIDNYLNMPENPESETMEVKGKYKEVKPCELSAVDLRDRKVSYIQAGKAETIHFDHLIVADGGGRHSSRQLDIRRQYPLVELAESWQPRHKRFGTAVFKVSEAGMNELLKAIETSEPESDHSLMNPLPSIVIASPDKSDSINQLRAKYPLPDEQYLRMISTKDMGRLQNKYSWEEPFVPVFYLGCDFENRTICWAGEIPTNLSQDSVEKWAKDIFKLKYKVLDSCEGIVDEMSCSSSSAYDVEHKHLQKNYVDLDGERLAVFVGDCAVSSNPLFGDGVTNAVLNGELLQEVFSTEDPSERLKKLDEFHSDRKNTMLEKSKEINEILKSNDDTSL